jgi:DNA polymerase-1
LSKKIRQLFIPDEGKLLVSADYASQEPRLQAEIAYRIQAPGASALVQAYRDNPELSLHEYVRDLCNAALKAKGETPFLEKHHAKPINLGIPYGSGKRKVAAQISDDVSIGEQVYDTYVAAFPSVLWSRDYFDKMGRETGAVQTLFGRKSRFDRWQVDVYRAARLMRWSAEETAKKKVEFSTISGTLAEIREKYPSYPLSRCQTYAGLNRVIQGSAADQTKLAMMRMYYLHNTVPLIQVHDEILFQVGDLERVESIVQGAMNEAVKLVVPVVTEYEVYAAGWCSEVLKKGVLVNAT